MARDTIEVPTKQFSEINTLHELLALALDDFEIILKDDRYQINMNVWYLAMPKQKCAVCLAGAVIANRFGGDDTYVIDPRLYALDMLRKGDVNSACVYIGKYAAQREESLTYKWCYLLAPWRNGANNDWHEFVKVMREMQRDLEDANI